jgi:hypothetical protein
MTKECGSWPTCYGVLQITLQSLIENKPNAGQKPSRILDVAGQRWTPQVVTRYEATPVLTITFDN